MTAALIQNAAALVLLVFLCFIFSGIGLLIRRIIPATFSSPGETLFFSSDFMPDRHHLPLPWIPSQDLYPLDTLAAKKVILPRAIEEGWIVGFTHDLPRFGRIRQEEGRYRFDELPE